MRWKVGTKLALGFGAALLIFLIVGLVSYRSTVELLEASDSRKYSYDVMLQIEQMQTSLAGLEAAQRSYLLTGDESYLADYRRASSDINEAMQVLRKLTLGNASQQSGLDRIEPIVRNRLAVADQTIELRRSQGLEAASKFVLGGTGKALAEEIVRINTQLGSEESELLERRTLAAQRNGVTARRTIVLGTLAAIALAALAGWMITRDISPPLQQLTALAERVAAGDLNVTLSAQDRSDEVGVLSQAFVRMTGFLRAMAGAAEQIAVGDLRASITPLSDKDALGLAFAKMSANLRQQISELIDGANTLGSSSSQIVASTAQLAAGASQSATAVSETTTTVEEVRQTAQMANQKARTVSDSAQKAEQASLSGRKATEDMIAGMARIRGQMDAIAASMMRLSEQGQAIGQIIASVDDLAAQSNLLAVNASIEAAKAGEHGKGFGVVAQEVKSLAEQSRQATNQVRTILNDIQKATSAAVMATEQGAKAVESGSTHTQAAGESIQQLMDSVSEAAQAATQIAASSQQQLVGMDQVAAAMGSIRQASAQNVASARQLETAARSLDDLGRRLRRTVERYAL